MPGRNPTIDTKPLLQARHGQAGEGWEGPPRLCCEACYLGFNTPGI